MGEIARALGAVIAVLVSVALTPGAFAATHLVVNGAGGISVEGVAVVDALPVEQGGLLFGEAEPGTKIWLGEQPIQMSDDGRFVIGFDRDAGPEAVLRIEPAGTAKTQTLVTVAPREYRIQRIDGVPPKTVRPPPEDQARIEREWLQKQAAKKRDTPETWFASDFIWPATGPITGVFGSARVYNGQERKGRFHNGVDVAAPEGTPIVAPAPGRVTLAEPDMYFEGGLIFLDHGHGLLSIIMHMSRLDVVEGQVVEAGDLLGAIGSTGRSTGPHLHWGMIWLDVKVDPQKLVPPMPQPETPDD